MVGEKRKLNVLSIQDKIKILKFVDENKLKKKIEIAAYFKIPSSTLSTIIKNRETIEKNYDGGNRKKMKIRNSTYPEVEECVRKWFVQCRNQNIPLSGLMLQQKAEDFAKELDVNSEFKASNGWLENFKKRHNIVFRKLCGESASVNTATCEEWLSELPSLLKDYKADDVFNADETGLFYQCLPNKTAAFKGEECRGGKQSKLRITVLLAANQSGKEKLPPLMIGRSKKPRCFAKIKSFPMLYRSNIKAWMTSTIFADWLKEIDKTMAKSKRHILLFIDNCKAHSYLPRLKNITVKFLPPNTTSKLQPLDQGIIRSFKVDYRAQIVRRLLDNISEGKSSIIPINILQSMRMAHSAWRNVTETTIRNCFIKAGFSENLTSSKTEEIDLIEQATEEGELNPEQWESIQKACDTDISFEEFLKVDDELETCGTMTDEEIVSSINSEISDEEIQDEQEHEKITVKEAEKAVDMLWRFLESSENIKTEAFGAIAMLEKTVQLQKDSVRRQTSIKDFFLPK